MNPKMKALRKLRIDDICHGECPNGASLICLVTNITETRISVRTVTTQYEIDFDRATGLEITENTKSACYIDSVAPLPADIHEIMLSLDRKYRFATNPEDAKLTPEQKRGLYFIADFYPENQL